MGDDSYYTPYEAKTASAQIDDRTTFVAGVVIKGGAGGATVEVYEGTADTDPPLFAFSVGADVLDQLVFIKPFYAKKAFAKLIGAGTYRVIRA